MFHTDLKIPGQKTVSRWYKDAKKNLKTEEQKLAWMESRRDEIRKTIEHFLASENRESALQYIAPLISNMKDYADWANAYQQILINKRAKEIANENKKKRT